MWSTSSGTRGTHATGGQRRKPRGKLDILDSDTKAEGNVSLDARGRACLRRGPSLFWGACVVRSSASPEPRRYECVIPLPLVVKASVTPRGDTADYRLEVPLSFPWGTQRVQE